jgi:TonB family protein
MNRIVSMMAFLFVMTALAVGQDVLKAINGGILNGKAVKLPKPAYPAEANAAKLEGTVRIKITIDEEGNVISAESSNEPYEVVQADGSRVKVDPEYVDPSLIEAARQAALEAQFRPTRLSGQPVKVTGVIVYNFKIGDDRAISGGILNGKAVELPSPTYPAAARAVKASGTVAVQIVIDENGDVISATAVSGHPLLRGSATDAARAAKFAPTRLNGAGVKVSGVLTYNFVLPDDTENK